MDFWTEFSTKEERRGRGRKGVITNKPRSKWNCSRRNHGCHGYVNEKVCVMHTLKLRFDLVLCL